MYTCIRIVMVSGDDREEKIQRTSERERKEREGEREREREGRQTV